MVIVLKCRSGGRDFRPGVARCSDLRSSFLAGYEVASYLTLVSEWWTGFETDCFGGARLRWRIVDKYSVPLCQYLGAGDIIQL